MRGKDAAYPTLLKVRAKHRSRYLREFSCGLNRREEEGIFMMTLARLLGTIAMPYKQVVAEPTE